MKIFKTLIILTLFLACKNTNSTETPKNPAVEVDTIVNEETPVEEKIWYYATVDKLRLRSVSNKDGAVLEQIEEGGKLLFLNEKTDTKERIKLRDQWFEEPWLKVESRKGNIGWVYGGAVTTEVPKEDVSKLPYDACEAAYAKNQNYKDWYDCYTSVSKAQTRKNARYIKETPTGYQVTLLSGETKNLVNENGDGAGEEFREYSFKYYLDKVGYFIFSIRGFESRNFLMLDDKFGYAMPIQGMPRLSPDMKKILISNSDGDSGFEFNGIQLLEVTDEGINPEPIFDETIDRYQPLNPVWVDDKTVEFDFVPFSSDTKSKRLKAKLVKGEDGVWNLTLINQRE